MIRWFWNLLYESQPMDFVSAFGLEESVQRLAAATERPNYRSTEETAIGTVSESRVRLHRYIPTLSNGLKPVFVGRFVRERGRVVLKGRFSSAPFGKVFMTVWFAFLGFMTVFGFHAVLTGAVRDWLFPLSTLGLFGGAVAVVWWCRRMARKDVAWLSELIERALGVR